MSWSSGRSTRPGSGKGPFEIHFGINPAVVVFLVLLTLLVNLLAGLGPALQATKRDVTELLKSQTAGSHGLRIAGFQRFLVVAQVAMSAVILAGAAFLAGSSRWLTQPRTSYNPEAVWTARVDFALPGDPRRFFEELDRDLSRAPGVEAVGLTSQRIAFSWATTFIEIEGKSYPRPEDHPAAGGRVVSPGFFDALKLPLLKGRGFGPNDGPGAPRVAVVNTTFAKRFLGDWRPGCGFTIPGGFGPGVGEQRRLADGGGRDAGGHGRAGQT